jgi:hypothetical protein
LGCLAMAPSASANHHFVQIREVFPGSTTTNLGTEYVELQMWSPFQNVLTGQSQEIRFYDEDGNFVTGPNFSSNPPNAANQSTILMATEEAEADFMVTADQALPFSPDNMNPAGGAVCFTSITFNDIDCVAWGSLTDFSELTSNADPSEATIPDGSAIERTTARGCATLLEPADDTNDSLADFAAATPNPEPNSVSPNETACTGGGGPTPGSCAGRTATKTGTNGANVIRGTAGVDVIAGLGGNDTIRGLAGNDFLCGGGGRDKLIGGGGRDKLFGQAGRDICKGGPKKDTARKCETKRTI